MRGKHKRIVQAVRSAQKAGRKVNSNELAACYGKVRYSKDRAFRVAEAMVEANAYRCKYCNFYHVGRKPWK